MTSTLRRFVAAGLLPTAILLVMLALMSSPPVTHASPLPDTDAARAELSPPQQEEGVDLSRYDLWVVRAFFTDREMVTELASWLEPWEVHYEKGYVVVGVTPQQYQSLLDAGFRLEIDEATTVELNLPRPALPNGGGIPGYSCYRTVEETYATAEEIVAAHPDLATWVDIGDSWLKTQDPAQGYDMMVLRLTNSAIAEPKPKLFVMSAIHAREYTTAELNTRFAEFLVNNYGVDADATWLLDHNEIHLLLQSNPDGRKRAETGLLWRKNVNNNFCSNSNSRGIDLNRNFEFQWGCCGGSSGDPCSETFRGPSPASEPEVQAVQDYVRSIFPDQREDNLTDPAPDDATGVFLDLHSYSELVLWPWGFTQQDAPNGTALQTLGRKFAYFNDYYPDQAIGLYPTDGTTDDFAYGELGVAAYTFEMGTAFFQSCSTFENTIVPANMPALVYAAKAARTPYLSPAGPDSVDVGALPNSVAPGDAVTLSAEINDTQFNNQNGTEPTQPIAAAEYYIDITPWDGGVGTPMSPADGSFNSSVEDATAELDTAALSTGQHTIYVRGQDSAGNWGVPSATFLYVIDPAVAPTIQGYVREASSNQPLEATVRAGESFQTTTDPETGFYQMQVISGTYDLTASAPDHATQTVSNVEANNQQTIEQDFTLNAVCAAFTDDVEMGTNGWSAQAPWAITTENANSPTHSWTDSPGGNYGNNRNVSLTSPILDLSDYGDVTLDFAQICSTESGYDYCHVEVSSDGGTSWDEVAAYDGPHNQWEQVSLSVPQLAGAATARVRFRLTSDVSLTADGWHVDDIALRGSSDACNPPPPTSIELGSLASSPQGMPWLALTAGAFAGLLGLGWIATRRKRA